MPYFQTLLRLGPHPPRRQERSRHLVRPRGLRPQPGQDRYPRQLFCARKHRRISRKVIPAQTARPCGWQPRCRV